MNRLTLILTFLLSLMFASPSYSEWIETYSSADGDIFYVDFETIRKVDGYVYYWMLANFLNPRLGNMSSKVYSQGDCKLFRIKVLSFSFHKEPMGGGTGGSNSPENPEWKYPPLIPDSSFTVLKSVCGMSSSLSYSEWTQVSEDASGNTHYVDFERIKKHDGSVYFWGLTDYLKPINGMMSGKSYQQGDCKLFRIKFLSYSFHDIPMGGGTGETHSLENPEWNYPLPNSSIEDVLKSVCSR